MIRSNDKELVDFIILNEGLRFRPYKDTTDHWTVGYGFNLEAHNSPPWLTKAILDKRPISKTEALKLLLPEIDFCIHRLAEALPWFSDITRNRQIALVDMCFNMGIGKLMGFKHTLAAMADGLWEDAGDGIVNSKYYTQVGNRGPRVVALVREG